MGVLAGNTFDWGAKETVALMKKGDFDFKQARKRIPGMMIYLIIHKGNNYLIYITFYSKTLVN